MDAAQRWSLVNGVFPVVLAQSLTSRSRGV